MFLVIIFMECNMDNIDKNKLVKKFKNLFGAKKIKGYTSKLKSTVTLPILDKLNDTEYFSYYVFSFDEILLSRI